VPVTEIERLSVSYGRIRSIVKTSLATLASNGRCPPLFVQGEWGSGKSHLLEFVRAATSRTGIAHVKIDLNAREAALNHPQRFYPWMAESLMIENRQGLRCIVEDAFSNRTTRDALLQFAWAPASGSFGRALQKIILQSRDQDCLADDPAWSVILGLDLPWSDSKRAIALERLAATARFLRAIRAGGLVMTFDEVETLDQLWNRLSRAGAYDTLGTVCGMDSAWAVFGVTQRFNNCIRHDLDQGILGCALPGLAGEFLRNWRDASYRIVEPPQLADEDASKLAQLVVETYSAAYPATPVGKARVDDAVAIWRINPARNQRRLIRSVIDALDARRPLERLTRRETLGSEEFPIVDEMDHTPPSPRNDCMEHSSMDLFTDQLPDDDDDVRKEFHSLLKRLNRSGTSSKKNKPMEHWLRQLTGWPAVGFKYVGDTKNLHNRISEIQNRPDKPRHVIVLVSPDSVAATRLAAEKLIGVEKKYDAIGIASDGKPPMLTDFYHRGNVVLPKPFSSGFPTIKVHRV
jgi:hypothetical protein